MHATVRQLEELGAVRRQGSGRGRKARLEVTDRGRELMAIGRGVATRLDRELFDDLGFDQRPAVYYLGGRL